MNNWIQKNDHICKDEKTCEFCLLEEEEEYERRIQNATFLLDMEQLSIVRHYPTEIVLRAKESDLHDYREGNRRERNTSPPRIHTFQKSDRIRNPQTTLPSSPLGESERKCRAEQDVLFKGSGFLRNGYMSEERWASFKRIMERDSISRGIWELGLSENRTSENLGDDERKTDL